MEYIKPYSLLIDQTMLRRIRTQMALACLEAMVAEHRFTYTDIFTKPYVEGTEE